MTTAPLTTKHSRKLAVFASLWLAAINLLGYNTNGGLLFSTVFALLTIITLGVSMVSETRRHHGGRMTLTDLLWFLSWFAWLSALALFPLWMLIVLVYVR